MFYEIFFLNQSDLRALVAVGISLNSFLICSDKFLNNNFTFIEDIHFEIEETLLYDLSN